MTKIVTITNQGQITIPATMRRRLALDKYRKASVRTEDSKIVVEPIPDLLSLAGTLQDKAIKNKSIDEIIKLEEEFVGRNIAREYRRKNK